LADQLSPAFGYFVPGSGMYGLQKAGPIEEYALADLYAWLEAHSGFTHPYRTLLITNGTLGTNMTSSSK